MASPSEQVHALAGLRVLEIGSLIAGPFAGRLLADFGAEVIKIESPRRPDPFRDWGQGKVAGRSLWWPVQTRNKKLVTRNTAVANAFVAVETGASVLDASVGGIGGCPFAPGATGNVATEDLVYLLHREGVDTGIDIETLIAVAHWPAEVLGRPLTGRLQGAGVPRLSRVVPT
jgi:hypothetical protein